MSRKLLIFGNGLGMAIDHSHYSLTNALKTVWADDSLWSNTVQRDLIQNCIPSNSCPVSEEELDKLYLVSTSCNYLDEFPNTNNGEHWLSDYGHDFTSSTQEYIHTVASYLFDSSSTLPTLFSDALTDFVRTTKSHVATLNYDKLLYDAFISANICNGFSGQLVDGFTHTSGFNSSNLVRRFTNKFGYYMHLHGSPLFQDIGDTTYKLATSQISTGNIFGSQHIVLTHIPHKPSVITASAILSTYWNYLILSLSEVDEIILFGYSGCDTHLNKILKIHANSKIKTIVEWDGDSTLQQRQIFWNKELGNNVMLNRMPDITKFTSW